MLMTKVDSTSAARLTAGRSWCFSGSGSSVAVIPRAVFLALGLALASGCATTGAQQGTEQLAEQPAELTAEQLAEQAAEQQLRQVEEHWGVEIQGVRLTSADYMLDFRYRVVDVDKAAPILDRHIKPHVIVERSGYKLQVPISSKLGPLRQTQTHPEEGRNYYAFFANPARHVKQGDLVTVVVGDFSVEHLPVQ
jgi:hypothetical protein